MLVPRSLRFVDVAGGVRCACVRRGSSASLACQVREDAALHGVNPKSSGEHGWAGAMARRFERFLNAHGAEFGYDAEKGPELGLVRAFMDWCASGAARLRFSCVGRTADHDQYMSVHMPYTLAQKLSLIHI